MLGSTIAHELGHRLEFTEEYCHRPLDFPCSPTVAKFSFNNPPPQNSHDGDRDGNFIREGMQAFDVNDFLQRVVDPTQSRQAIFGPPGSKIYGYMGAGNDVNSWTTQTAYEFLYATLTKPEPARTPGRAQALVNRQTAREVVALFGRINRNGAATLDPLLIFTTAQEFPRPLGTTVTVEFRDATGLVLDQVSFDPLFKEEVLAGQHTGALLAPCRRGGATPHPDSEQ